MTVLARIEETRKLWETILPHVPAPPPEDIARWLVHPDSVVERAVLITANRFSKLRVTTKFNPVEAYRYATALTGKIAENQAMKEVPPATTKGESK